MFPIRWNEIFRKKDGTLGTMEDLGGGSPSVGSGSVQITRYVTNLTGASTNVKNVSSEAPSPNSRLIGIVNNLAYNNKIVSGSTVISAVGLCFDSFSGENPNCFYCYVNNNLSNAKFDLIWWVPSDT